MPDAVTHILRLPLFPIVILALIALLYWRGAFAMRQQRKPGGTPEAKTKSD